MCQVLLWVSAKQRSAQWKQFKSESLLDGGIRPILNTLGWEANNALAVSKGY